MAEIAAPPTMTRMALRPNRAPTLPMTATKMTAAEGEP